MAVKEGFTMVKSYEKLLEKEKLIISKLEECIKLKDCNELSLL